MGHESFSKYKVGTLVDDMGKIGILSKIIPYGTMKTEINAIKWRTNYEITYVDGEIQIIAELTFCRLIERGDIRILNIER